MSYYHCPIHSEVPADRALYMYPGRHTPRCPWCGSELERLTDDGISRADDIERVARELLCVWYVNGANIELVPALERLRKALEGDVK